MDWYQHSLDAPRRACIHYWPNHLTVWNIRHCSRRYAFPHHIEPWAQHWEHQSFQWHAGFSFESRLCWCICQQSVSWHQSPCDDNLQAARWRVSLGMLSGSMSLNMEEPKTQLSLGCGFGFWNSCQFLLARFWLRSATLALSLAFALAMLSHYVTRPWCLMGEDSTLIWLPSLTAGGHACIPRVIAWVAWERSPMQAMDGRPYGFFSRWQGG